MKKFFLFMSWCCLLSLLSGCSLSNKEGISTFDETVYATIDDKTIWSHCELIDHNGVDTQGYPHPITSTSIYLSSYNTLNKKDAKLITELPLIAVDSAGREVLTRVTDITPANNNWIVIEEYLAAADWNQGSIRIIGMNLETKEQRAIASGGRSGGLNFKYMVKGNYVFWSEKALDETRESAIMNLLTGEKQTLVGVDYDSKVVIENGIINADDKVISIEI
ncbi:hypothetical protein [Pelotomaculum sp. PtaB.Bin117]|uniref:hypothetical protein n=1 Tax=Pelotomaculum sp. PtaB.Bin117 TaxID=1811694 RepID=UPI0009D0389E|nr:hypothetical protein [Pelotomaculum sp. PtaB.Bin117]OPX91725.1 MAG: hypothetical protein A4E54_00146 [Pelotomaculum sp. PtaB.Bin117]